MHKSAFIFDMDGVLVDSTPYHLEAWEIALKRYGYNLATDFKVRPYGRRGRDILGDIAPEMSEEKIDEFADAAEKIFRDIYESEVEQIDNVVEFINHLKRRGYKIALATSAPRENVDMILSVLHLVSFFDPVVCENDVERGKPEPDIYLKVLEILREKPENCIVFEDSFAGIESAKRASIEVIGVISTNEREELEKVGIRVIESFDELLREL